MAAPCDISEPVQAGSDAGAVEDVVAQDKCDGAGADVVGADQERLRQSVGPVLDRIADVDAEP